MYFKPENLIDFQVTATDFVYSKPYDYGGNYRREWFMSGDWNYLNLFASHSLFAPQ